MTVQTLDDRVMDSELPGDDMRALKCRKQLVETTQQTDGVTGLEPAKVALIAQVGAGDEWLQNALSPGSRIR